MGPGRRIPLFDPGSHPDPTWIPPRIPPSEALRVSGRNDELCNSRGVDERVHVVGAVTETEDEHTRSMQTYTGHAFQDAPQDRGQTSPSTGGRTAARGCDSRGECNTATEDEHTRSMQTYMGHVFQDAQQTEVRHRPRLEDAPRQEDATHAAWQENLRPKMPWGRTRPCKPKEETRP